MAGNRPSIEVELGRLRAEISTLLNLPALSPEFTNWLGKLFAVVAEGFGNDSDEIRRLRAISPELPSEFYDSIAGKLDTLGLSDAFASQLRTILYRDAPQEVFRRRLYEYDDFIAGMIHSLPSRN